MYSALKLNSDLQSQYQTENSVEIMNLSRINIFIGPNNCGKSRFLRSLFIEEDPSFRIEQIELEEVIEVLKVYKDTLDSHLTFIQYNGFIPNEILDFKDRYFNRKQLLKTVYSHIKNLTSFNKSNMGGTVSIGNVGSETIAQYIKVFSVECLNNLEKFDIDNINFDQYQRENIYIPTLRGLRSVITYSDQKNEVHIVDHYKNRTISDYFIKKEKLVENKIFTGLNLFQDIKKLLLGVSKERQKVKDFETFLSETFFGEREVNIIPHIDSNVVYVKIGDDDDRPIYDLGEGIQSIIILTYPLFLNQGENMNFFFEEPDLFLHPGYQRIFLETLNDKRFSSFQYFFTTHSNHFLDMTLDFSETSVYAFHREAKDKFRITNIKNADKDILQALGARNSSVFLTNCTIWVEGITDRIYIRKYLEILMAEKEKNYKEDVHFSFVEYGGNNITHWSFLEDEDGNFSNIDVESLCGKLFLISDSDNATTNKKGEKSKKLLRQGKLAENLGDNFYCLTAKEIENILMPDVIIKTIKDFERNECSKIDFKNIESAKYNNTYLGEYIDSKVLNLSRKYSSKSKTVANKVQFAKYAVSHIESLNDISQEGKIIAEKIYDFICKNN